MPKQNSEFVLIILKPAAANDAALSNRIISKLAEFGDICYLKKKVKVSKEKILQHYRYSKSSFWYPIITNYLSQKLVTVFILEQKSQYNVYSINKRQESFAKFLKTEIIGPSDICKTKKHHLRRLAMKKPTFLFDNLVHSSENTQEALEEICLWYEDEPSVVAEYEIKTLALLP